MRGRRERGREEEGREEIEREKKGNNVNDDVKRGFMFRSSERSCFLFDTSLIHTCIVVFFKHASSPHFYHIRETHSHQSMSRKTATLSCVSNFVGKRERKKEEKQRERERQRKSEKERREEN